MFPFCRGNLLHVWYIWTLWAYSYFKKCCQGKRWTTIVEGRLNDQNGLWLHCFDKENFTYWAFHRQSESINHLLLSFNSKTQGYFRSCNRRSTIDIRHFIRQPFFEIAIYHYIIYVEWIVGNFNRFQKKVVKSWNYV